MIRSDTCVRFIRGRPFGVNLGRSDPSLVEVAAFAREAESISWPAHSRSSLITATSFASLRAFGLSQIATCDVTKAHVAAALPAHSVKYSAGTNSPVVPGRAGLGRPPHQYPRQRP